MLKILCNENSIVNHYFRELRDEDIQKNKQAFRQNIERVASIAAYEVGRKLAYKTVVTKTVFGMTKSKVIRDQLVVATILRAGLPVYDGVMRVFENAESAFVAAARTEEKTRNGFEIKIDYISTPTIRNKVLILTDSMIATGNTIIKTYRSLVKKCGLPTQVYIVGIIASEPALSAVREAMPEAKLIIGAVDPGLNQGFMIVPGLGDAGDLLYGQKES